MSYQELVKSKIIENGWEKAADSFNNIEGKEVLLYTHDDPDGLTSGCILKRLAELKGASVTVKLPGTYELEASRLEKDLAEKDYKMVILSDKGTMGYYNDYVSKVDNFLIVDHHPPIGRPEECLLINPNMDSYNSCSASYIAHMLITYHGLDEGYDDYLALVGLKGDWAVEPATDMISPYVAEFYKERIEGPFASLVEKISSRPTMFEYMQREKTTLLNQISELYFALGGGGFQYFYNDRDPRLADIDQAVFSFELMEKKRSDFDFKEWKSLEDFIDRTGEKEIVGLIFELFKEDWEKAINAFSGSELIATLANNDIYRFIGENVALMPMAGSVYNNELKERSPGKNILFVMINKENTGGVHFSLRGTAPELHAGKICSNLSKRLVEKFGNPDQITGGGHPFAAECKTRNSGVKFEEALEVFNAYISDMKKAAETGDAAAAAELGLDYIK